MGVPVSTPLFEIDGLHVSVEGTEILKGVDLAVGAGRGARPHGPERLRQVHPGQHPAREPRYQVTAGRIRFKGDDITDWPTDVRGKAGMFLAFQYPEEIPGVP